MKKKQKVVITEDTVKHLSKLANLQLTEREFKNIVPALSSVLSYVSKIQSLDTAKVSETSQVTGLENVFREDKVDKERMLSQEEALSNAKKKHNGYFVINAIFEE